MSSSVEWLVLCDEKTDPDPESGPPLTAAISILMLWMVQIDLV